MVGWCDGAFGVGGREAAGQRYLFKIGLQAVVRGGIAETSDKDFTGGLVPLKKKQSGDLCNVVIFFISRKTHILRGLLSFGFRPLELHVGPVDGVGATVQTGLGFLVCFVGDESKTPAEWRNKNESQCQSSFVIPLELFLPGTLGIREAHHDAVGHGAPL